MDQNLRNSISMSRFNQFLMVGAITWAVQVSTMFAIVFGSIAGKELIIGSICLGSGIIGSLGTVRTMTDLHNLLKDMDDDMLKTNYGAEISKAPIPVIRSIILVVYALSVISQLGYLFF